MAKNYEELTFTDDFMFGKVVKDPGISHDLLEYLTREPVGMLEEIQSQHQIKDSSEGKPVQLDLYTRDQKRIYDAEMQNRNHKKIESLDLPKRSRYYQSMMDSDYLKKGNHYKNLLEGLVLFLCTFDPFGKGVARYTFENQCLEFPELKLKDGTSKTFFNCSCRLEDTPEELKSLYDYLQNGNVTDDLTARIDAAVIRARLNEKWKAEYMKELVHEEDIREEGREEGVQRVNRLYSLLQESGRTDDILRSISDRDYQNQLFEEFHLGSDTVNNC